MLTKKESLLAALVLTAGFSLAQAQSGSFGAPITRSYGPQAGQMEFGVGANGVSNRDVDDTAGGGTASFGYYLNDTLAVVLRQSLNYSNSDQGDINWNGATRVVLDQHFTAPWARVRPYVGVSAGRIYGDAVKDTWAGGLEAGAKVYVQPMTFVYASAEYQWFFDEADRADNQFRDGQYIWSLGMGFNF